MSPESKIVILKDRALLFQKVRSFFSDKNVFEVDTPILSRAAPIDEHIEIMSVNLEKDQLGYLHSSPEYAMKRLLSLGAGDIFQMSHVFRLGEISPRHNPEFTMVEWYRIGAAFPAFIEETVEFIRLFLGNISSSILPYREAFLRFANIDYVKASEKELLTCAKAHNIELSTSSPPDKETLLHLLMGFVIEPHLGKDEILVLTDYPASQAALAETVQKEDELVAKRFEIYYHGIELANGYSELTDASVQKERLLETLKKRKQDQKEDLPLDENFLKALAMGIPRCCGVAVGFDRLMMLRHNTSHLEDILPLAWKEI